MHFYGDEAKNLYPDNSDYQKGIHWYTSFDSLSSQFKEYYECKEQVCSPSDLETCVMEEMNGSGPTWSRVSSSLNCVDLELSSFQNEITITMQCAVEKNEFLKCVEKLKDGGGYIGSGFCICWNIPEYAGIFWNVLEYAGIFRNMLERAGICWNIPEYAGMCWNMLEYAGIFQHDKKLEKKFTN